MAACRSFISIGNGKTGEVADNLYRLIEITYIGKSVGEHIIDLRVEAAVKDNGRLLDLLKKIEAMDGINDAVWGEIVTAVGKKISVRSSI